MLTKLWTVIALFCLAFAARADDCATHLAKPNDKLLQLERIQDQFKFTADGLIEFDAKGFPHRATYAAAREATELKPKDLQTATDSQQALVNRLKTALDDTDRKIFSGDNEKLLTTRYAEKISPRNSNKTLYDYLNSGRYKVGWWWWMRMDENEKDQRNFKGERIKAPTITVNSSKSSVLKGLDGGHGSFIFWSVSHMRTDKGYDSEGAWREESHIIADLQGPHIRVNVDKDGKELSLELIARTPAPTKRNWYGKKLESTEWSAFMFEKIGDVWVPRIHELNQDKTTRCITCHHAQDGTLSPKPFMLNSVADFMEVGYRDRFLIEQFLKSF